MDLNALRCRRCGASIDVHDVHEDLAIAKCRYCGAVMDLGQRDESASAPLPPKRPMLPIPERFKVHEEGGALTIEWRWFTGLAIFLLFFCIAWDSFLVTWYTKAAAGGDSEADPLLFLFPLVHVAVGAGLTWYTLALFTNRTRIEVQPGLLRIRHFPLPWPGNRELKTSEIAQLFCDETAHRGENSTSYTYNLNMVLAGSRKRVKLLGRLEKPELALFLEQKLESALGIRDVPVSGELPKD